MNYEKLIDKYNINNKEQCSDHNEENCDWGHGNFVSLVCGIPNNNHSKNEVIPISRDKTSKNEDIPPCYDMFSENEDIPPSHDMSSENDKIQITNHNMFLDNEDIPPSKQNILSGILYNLLPLRRNREDDEFNNK